MSDPNRSADKAAARAAAELAYSEAIAGLEFTAWPKIARLNREVTISEKLDGTNAAVGITTDRVYAQSRTRIITPGKTDNFGFAAWVEKNADLLRTTLGEGLHFGEWWGEGVGRRYGLTEKRFSLFNTAQWGTEEGQAALREAQRNGLAIYSVPVLYTGPWINEDGDYQPNVTLDTLRTLGSAAAPGFMKPEGIVVFHKASGQMFKATVEKDEQWKGLNAEEAGA